jgi:hypothetical protein
MEKGVYEVGIIGVLDFLYVDSHEFSQFRNKLRAAGLIGTKTLVPVAREKRKIGTANRTTN